MVLSPILCTNDTKKARLGCKLHPKNLMGYSAILLTGGRYQCPSLTQHQRSVGRKAVTNIWELNCQSCGWFSQQIMALHLQKVDYECHVTGR